MNDQYIECEVFVEDGSYVPFYYFKYNDKIVRLAEAVNIPGFEGYWQEGSRDESGHKIFRTFLSRLCGEPKLVRFRVPVADNQPPKCEDCCCFDGGDCLNRAWKLTLDDGCKVDVFISAVDERKHGKCGPDGKCFVVKKRAANSGDVAKEEA